MNYSDCTVCGIRYEIANLVHDNAKGLPGALRLNREWNKKVMRFEEYRHYDAVALAGLVGKGEVSAGELLDVAIARAEAVNPKINAIVHKQYEQARATIGKGLLNGPLAGVPYLIKDLAIFEAV